MLAIIPARGGSKGLKGKNIKPLLGKPLIAYSIEAALAVPAIKKVFVSTDDPEIAKIAIDFGAECGQLRPANLATDSARAVDVYTHVLEEFSQIGQVYNEVIILQPTSPLRTSKNIIDESTFCGSLIKSNPIFFITPSVPSLPTNKSIASISSFK